MKLYIVTNFYGLDLHVIAQAAEQADMRLIAVKGYSPEDYPGDPEYVEGDAQYIFELERPQRSPLMDMEERERLRRRISVLFAEKYPETTD